MNKNVKMTNPMKVITGPNTRWSYANVWEPKSINGALELVDTFITKMNGWLGEGSARHYAISDKGAYAAWL